MKVQQLLSVSFVITNILDIHDPAKTLLDNIKAEFEHIIYQNTYIDTIEKITRRGLFIVDDRLDACCSVSVEFLANTIKYLPGEIVLATVTAIDDINLFAKGYNFIININIPTMVKAGQPVPAIQFEVGKTYPFMVKNTRAVNGRREINISGHVVINTPATPIMRVMTPPELTFETQHKITSDILANKPVAWEFFSKLFGDTNFDDIVLATDTNVYMPMGTHSRVHVCAAGTPASEDDTPVEDTGDNILRDFVNRRMVYILNLNTLGVLKPDEIMQMKPALSFIVKAAEHAAAKK